MRSIIRQLRKAPARVIATIASLALAIAALGVFAVPTVSTATLREAAEQDHLAHVTAPLTPIDDVDSLGPIDSLEEIEGRIEQTVGFDTGDEIPLVGLDFDAQAINLVSAESGRLPGAPFEALAHDDLADLGDEMAVDGKILTVVGIGSTSARSDEPSVFVSQETAATITDIDGMNLVLLRLAETGDEQLDAAVEDLRSAVAAKGGNLTAFPETRAEGTHPIDEDIANISMMIGGLGVVAGLVALILLASTTNTLIGERTREAAIMRSLGSRRRPLRRRLRRPAIAMAATGALIGIPLGIALSNVIANMVLVKFVGLTPGVAIAWPVVIVSAVFAVVGARVAAGHAARRVTKIPLAEALRDHDGAPFGRRWSDRVLAKLPTGGLLGRVGVRNSARRRARSFGVVAQAGAGVAAFVIVASMSTSIASYDEAAVAPWKWETMTSPADPGYPYDSGIGAEDGVETALYTYADVGEWQIEVFGVEATTEMVDTTVESGSWLVGSAGDTAVITEGFAEFEGIEVGDEIEVELVSGPTTYEVVGTHSYRSRAIFVEREALAGTLGAPGSSNIVWTSGSVPPDTLSSGVSNTVGKAEAVAEDRAARAAVLYIFTAIGVVVVAVSAISLSSTMLVNMHERRHEMAALRSVGARRSQLRRLLTTETVPLVLAGWAVGLAAGWAGSAALIAMFEAADAVHIGFVFASAAVPITAAVVVVGTVVLAHVATRTTARHSPAAVLRTSA